MTQISEIHGLPTDEFFDRGQNVAAKDYFPYLSMTSGEMRLMLARQRAQIFAGFYPEVRQYRQAVTMLDNALNAGISNGVHFVGAIHDDYLQQVARIIQSASRQTAPASRSAFARENKLSGIGSIIPAEQRRQACIEAAKKKVRNLGMCKTPPYSKDSYCDLLLKKEIRACEKAFAIESILNTGLEKSGHHMVYKNLPTGYPPDVSNKRILHRTGVEGLAIVGKIGNPLMYEWVENSIMLKNTGVGIAPFSSPITSFYLSPDPEAEIAKYTKLKKDKTSGAMPGIGFIDPATGAIIVKVVSAITGAILASAALLKALRSEEAYAMSESRGFGTEAFSANQEDWPLSQQGQSDESDKSATAGINPLLLLGGAAALFLLMDDEK